MTTFTPPSGGADNVHDLAALYAVDALDSHEVERFTRHLASCPACQREVAEMRTAGTALALATAIPMPPGLRSRVLAEIARQPQALVASAPSAPPAIGDGRPPAEGGPGSFDLGVTTKAGPPAESRPGSFDPAVTGAGAEVVELDAARRRLDRELRAPGRRRPPRLLAVAAAAAVVAVAGVAGALALAGRGGPGGPAGDRAAAEVAFAAVQAAPDARTLALAGGDPGAMVQVAWSATQNRAVLLADGLPDPGSARTYELWRIDGDGPAPAGLFDPDGSGRAGLVAPLDGADPTAWGVTVEPDGGSAAPTPPIVYQAEA